MVRVKRYDDPKRFWDEVAPSLRAEEAMNGLMLGLSRFFVGTPDDCLYQGVVFQDGVLAGALICAQYRDTKRNLIASPLADLSLAGPLFQDFWTTAVGVTSLIGELKTAKEYEKLIQANGLSTVVNMKQGIYRCRKVIPPKAMPGLTFRAATMADLDRVAEWTEAFNREAVPHDPPLAWREFATARITNGMIFVLERESRIVSMAGMTRDIGTSCSVNLVYTPKSERGKGYGSRMTAALTHHLLEHGRRETNLFTDLTNPTSNKIYQDIGYEFVCESVHLGVQPFNTDNDGRRCRSNSPA